MSSNLAHYKSAKTRGVCVCDSVKIPRTKRYRTILFVCIELDGTLGDIQCEIQGTFKCRSTTEYC